MTPIPLPLKVLHDLLCRLDSAVYLRFVIKAVLAFRKKLEGAARGGADRPPQHGQQLLPELNHAGPARHSRVPAEVTG